MKTTKDLHEIAESNGLEIIETTSQANGYPSNLKYAIIGFETFEDAEKLATEHDLEIQSFEKRDGWQLWARTGNTAYEPFKNNSDDYGDNYSEFDGGSIDEETFLQDEVLERLSDFNNFEDLQNFINSKKEFFEEIEKAGVHQKVITYMGDYYETIDAESMYFSHDTHHYVIGLINTNED